MVSLTAAANLDLAAVSPVVANYFAAFNRADYGAIAALFAADGALLAPFEDPIVGQGAIRAYLEAEAVHMQATPLEATAEPDDQGGQTILVQGRVKALLFTVNVRWSFVLSATGQIQSAEIKLLASLQELMQLNRGQ